MKSKMDGCIRVCMGQERCVKIAIVAYTTTVCFQVIRKLGNGGIIQLTKVMNFIIIYRFTLRIISMAVPNTADTRTDALLTV